MPRAIGTLSDQVKSKKFKNALIDIKSKIVRGESLSGALSVYPDIFSELFHGLIKVGEESGTLEGVLETIGLQLEKEHTLKSTIQGAMIYPSVIITAMAGVGVLMLVMVIPKLSATFEELNVELPPMTQIVISIGNFLSQNWILFLIGILVSVVGLIQLLKIKEIKKIIDKISLKIPIISPIITSTNSAYMLRTLSSLISAGTPLPRALEITSGTLGNFYFKNSLQKSAEQVRKGAKLSKTLSSYEGVYPSIVIQMIAVGEETGETSSILSNLASFFEEEVANTTKNLVSVIEPILMIVIGVVVGFFAVSMIQPMYSMLGAV